MFQTYFFLIIIIISCAILTELSEDFGILSKFHQNQYKMKDCRIEIERYDTSVYYYYKNPTFKYNRSVAAVNMTFMTKIDLPGKNVEVLVQAYKFASNEFRQFPVRFQVNLYKAVITNAVGIKTALSKGNFPWDDFVFKKDVKYHFYNMVPDVTHLPPLIPVGIYKAQTTMFYITNTTLELVVGDAFGEIYIPISK